MAKVMNDVILDVTKFAFATIAFIGISTNEVMTIDNTQWLSIH
jgi:hypothetical protein